MSLLAVACGPSIPSGIVLTPKDNTSAGRPRISALPVAALDWERQPLLVADSGDRPDGAPMSLTSSDGSGLQIESIQAQTVIQDPLAFTEIHFVFKNPEPRVIEGRFEITLPPGAAVSRFAMKQDFGWQEGEVVELQAAREAYEDALHRRVDPALLEKQAGNRFQARVFPIAASGSKEIIFSYSQELTRARDPYRLFLRGLPEVGSLDLRVLLDKPDPKAAGAFVREALEVHKKSFKPDRDLTIALPALSGGARGLRHEELAVARVTPIDEARPDKIESLVVLFDTSASRALGFRGQVERLGKLIEAVQKASGGDIPLAVVAFDQEAEAVFTGRAKDFGRRELGAIVDRRALGASDIGRAMRFAAKLKAPGGGRFARAVLFTDGIATAGATEEQKLAEDLAQLKVAGVERLDALVDGGIRDEALLKRITVGALSRNGVVLEAGLPPDALAQRLGSATVSGIKVNVPGSKWVWPAELDGIQPGDQAVVFAVIPKEAPFEVELVVGESRQKQAIRASVVERPLLERAAVNAQIQRLLDEQRASSDEATRASWKQRIIDLSTRYRVLSDYTALLVLETDEDYARFHIDRTALADILTVGPDGVELLNRKSRATSMVADARTAPAKAGESRDGADDSDEEAEKGASATETKAPEMKKESESAGAAPPAPPPPAAAPRPDSPADKADQAPASAQRPSPRPSPTATSPAPEVMPPPKRATMANEGTATGGASAPMASAAPITPPATRPRPEEPPAERPARPASRPSSVGSPGGGATTPRAARPGPVRLTDGDPLSPFEAGRPSLEPSPPDDEDDEAESSLDAYTGKFRSVMTLLAEKKPKVAVDVAQKWRDDEPGDALALVGLGEAFEALGDKKSAGRAYGSIIDLFPSRADLRRFAGARLERLGAASLELAVDTFRQAEAQRPDHPASHRMLAYALVRSGKMDEAFEAIVNGLRRRYPENRFMGVQYILFEDIGLIAAAWIRAEPAKKQEILARLAKMGVPLPTKPSLRFVLNWETDANDVDFHIRDGRRGHAFYSQPVLRSGGELYADVTTGYGPECFTIEGRPRAYPYKLQAHYYSRGPMGYGMGKLEVLEHDGQGGLTFDERPFVVMTDRAFVDLGVVKGPLKSAAK